KERSLVSSIQAALKDGSPEARKLAERDAMSLHQIRQDLTATREQLTSASHAFENAELQVSDIKEKLRAKMQEAQKAIHEAKKAEVMKQAAGALEELETYDTAATTEKYLDEIKQRVAESKAAVEIATGGLDIDRIKMERKAREVQGQSLLSEFEIEMGLKKPDTVAEAAPFPETAQAQPQAEKLPGT
ncbi:MAG TPA: hypothetical protein PK413_22540, partial [Thermoanaerobaculia bacterium]|nr:hypothetical protein [Thermoanaerobaculia bacterium]